MSYNIYDWEWLTRPLVLAIGALCLVLVFGGSIMKARLQRAAAQMDAKDD
jgi:putative tricarboxylic transport membrane protein